MIGFLHSNRFMDVLRHGGVLLQNRWTCSSERSILQLLVQWQRRIDVVELEGQGRHDSQKFLNRYRLHFIAALVGKVFGSRQKFRNAAAYSEWFKPHPHVEKIKSVFLHGLIFGVGWISGNFAQNLTSGTVGSTRFYCRQVGLKHRWLYREKDWFTPTFAYLCSFWGFKYICMISQSCLEYMHVENYELVRQPRSDHRQVF